MVVNKVHTATYDKTFELLTGITDLSLCVRFDFPVYRFTMIDAMYFCTKCMTKHHMIIRIYFILHKKNNYIFNNRRI